VVTYNVHQCLGRDGKFSPARVARMIARCNPDVLALQELDAVDSRANQIELVGELNRLLQTEFHGYPTIDDEMNVPHEFFGEAILSRYPLKLVRAAALPRLNSKRRAKAGPRGASWVTLDFAGHKIQILNAHLSHNRRERQLQVETLLGPDWLAHPDCDGSVIVCGNFKPPRKSRTQKLLGHDLINAQKTVGIHRPRRTWTGRGPLVLTERVFVSGPLQVLKASVSRSELSRLASDHFPLLVEVRVL
jgi:endonuclease/exonuclease/phosphatase family metal-dependent hydrolase